MDILHLVDRLEELFNESRPIPLTHQVVIDEDRFLEIIDQMRVSIPEEVKKARDVLARRDRVLAQAQEEAARTVELARQKGTEQIEREHIVHAAQTRADQILDQARVEADNMRIDADHYVVETLLRLEAELDSVMIQVRNGIAKIRAEQGLAESDGGRPLE